MVVVVGEVARSRGRKSRPGGRREEGSRYEAPGRHLIVIQSYLSYGYR